MSKLAKDVLLVVAAMGLLVFISCDEGTFVEPFDPDKQFNEDLLVIEMYVTERGLDPVDTLATSVRYAVTDNGDGQLVEVDNFVTLDFTAYIAETGQMLQTTLQSVADTSEVISTVSEPLVFRHTVNGWAFNDVFSQRGGATATNGFRDGVTAALNLGHNGQPEMQERGTATVVIPSREIAVTVDGVTNRAPNFPNAVIAYEISVRHVRK